MSQITLNSHDLLGKLTIIKNCLSMIIDRVGESEKKYCQTAFDTNQELIEEIKKLASEIKNHE